MNIESQRHPGASTVGSHLPDVDCSHWLANPGNRAMSPHAEGETGTHHTELTVERGKEGRGNAWRRASVRSNTYSKHHHCEGYQHVSVQEHMESWCMYISKTPLTMTEMQALFVVNSVKLHSTSFRETYEQHRIGHYPQTIETELVIPVLPWPSMILFHYFHHLEY